MNSTQLVTTLAPLISFLAGLAAGRGLFGWDVAQWTTVLGGIVGLGATVWAAITTRKSAQVSSVAAMPEVKEIKLESTPAGNALSASTPANVTTGS